jgi:Ca-activated chloride channel family protein
MDAARRKTCAEMERRLKTLRYLSLLALMLAATAAQAQERKLVREGNELYQQKKYKEAAGVYQKALKEQPNFVPGAFNLGNALIQQKQFDAARKVMDNTAKASKDPVVQGGAQYNKGNTYMSEQQWQQAVDAYKTSLRRNPQDQDAKYNLSYALSKLKQQQQQQKDKDKKDDKDQQKQQDKQDKKDKGDQNKDGKQPDQNQSQEGGDQKQAQKPQPSPSKLSQQQADNLLKALQQDERKTQDKMQQSKAAPVRLEKDW